MPPFDRLAWREPRPSPALIHALGLINRHFLLPHVLRLPVFDLPGEDLARLKACVRPGAAAFLAPNHPEFMTDWMIDKEISRRVSPLMAHWASYEVVNGHPLAQAVWLRNNLVANVPGGGGRAYSLRWARAGHGVLLHPEGAPSGHGDGVGPLVPGVASMAWDAARDAPEGVAVSVVPLVWKLHFTGDVGAALGREIAHVGRALGLAGTSDASAPLERRFAALHEGALARSVERFGGEAGTGSFFERQAAHADRLLDRLEARHGRGDGERPRRLHALRRAIHASAAKDPEAARTDRRTLAEIERLSHFTRERYGGPTWTQEQVAESVKQVRLALLRRGFAEALHGVVPVAVAPRVVRVRVPEPIDVRRACAAAGARDEAAAREAILPVLHARLREALDRVNAEIAPAVDPWRRPNPLA